MKQEEFNQQQQEEQTQPSLEGIAPGEIIIGILTGMNEQGQALVNYQENPSAKPVTAISTVALNQQQSGRQVALLFANGNPEKPVIMGLIHSPLDAMIENFEVKVEEKVVSDDVDVTNEVKGAQVDDVYLDGQRVVLEGKEEIVFKCGDASITLTKAGKILIRGKYLLNRSTGVNRIMGGSVQVN
ncbi:MAG: DUF6484 domain-containing protein [Gammaproteobacteria bacterium]